MPAFASLAVRLGHVQVISGGTTAMRMHYNDGVFKAVRDSDWSAGHAAVHGVTLDEVREAVLEHPYWAVPGPGWHDPDVRPHLRGPLLTRGDYR